MEVQCRKQIISSKKREKKIKRGRGGATRPGKAIWLKATPSPPPPARPLHTHRKKQGRRRPVSSKKGTSALLSFA